MGTATAAGSILNIQASGINVAGAIVATGDVTAFSDARLKKNIEVIPDALQKIDQVRGVTFERINGDDRRHTGVIAQELQAVLPEAVLDDGTGMLTVAYGNVVGLLIEAIKELNTKVEALQAQLEAQ
jgi:hypothetical protein